jgi:hypothetical protein
LATFLTNHPAQTAAIDFFTVPTATFRVLFVFVVLAHERRQLRTPMSYWRFRYSTYRDLE